MTSRLHCRSANEEHEDRGIAYAHSNSIFFIETVNVQLIARSYFMKCFTRDFRHKLHCIKMSAIHAHIIIHRMYAVWSRNIQVLQESVNVKLKCACADETIRMPRLVWSCTDSTETKFFKTRKEGLSATCYHRGLNHVDWGKCIQTEYTCRQGGKLS